MRAKLVATCLVATVWACGGATSSLSGDGGSEGGSSSGGSSGSSGSSGGSSSGGSTVCPASAPAAGTSCPQVGFECEYGDNANPACNQLVTCESGGWGAGTVSTKCPPPSTCPATYAAVAQGKACTPSGLDCGYAQGQCNCAGTVPVSGPGSVWQCSTPASGCPDPRPTIGDACSQPGLFCDYGSCTGGVAEQCEDGSWQVVVTPCPV